VIEVTFVGTGAAIPPSGRGNTVLAVRAPGLFLLIDAGPSVFDGLQQAGLDPTDITAIFLSHGHGDHVLGFPQLTLMSQFAEKDPPIKVFATASVRERLATVVRLTFPEALEGFNQFKWIELAEGPRQSYDVIDGVQLTTQMVFGPPYMPVLGMRLDFLEEGVALAYSADTAPSDSLASLATGCDLLVHEASFSAMLQPDVSPELYFHSDARQAGQIATRAGVKQLALVHLSSLHTDHRRVLAAEAREAFKGIVFVPDDGDTIRLGEETAAA
jgi:ribonuclease Z